jgi:formate-dependent nitrite reductase cytochrome c552 subunit
VPRPSQRPYNVEYYRRNRELELQRVRARQAGMVDLLRDLRRVPCADCGGRFKPHQMDFDHRDPSAKAFRVTAGRVMLMSTERVLAEVAKCDIVCANCHRIRTRDTERGRSRRDASGAPLQVLKARRWKEQAGLLEQLRSVPCADCGGRFEPCAMDFDHRNPANKRYTVTRMVGKATTEAILDEVAKCAIVCANCHRLRTWQRAERE